MRILIDSSDVVSSLLLQRLGAILDGSEWFLPMGGNKLVVCWCTSSEELSGKEFSLMEGKTNCVIPSWCPPLEDKVVLVFNQDRINKIDQRNLLGMLNKVTKEWEAPKRLKGRGGSVIFGKFMGTGRVITKPVEFVEENSVVTALTSLNGVHVCYGTTDLANVFELLQLVKSCHYLGLPGIYDIYSYAHTFDDYWNRIVRPSISVYGCDPVEVNHLLMYGTKKNTGLIQASVFSILLRDWGLRHAAYIASRARDEVSAASFYRYVSGVLVAAVEQYLGIKVNLRITTTEEIVSKSVLGKMTLFQVGDYLESQLRHSVVVANLDEETQLKSNALGSHGRMTIEQLHRVGGWLGGASLYAAMYSLGQFGPLVMMVKDSKAGLVHLAAERYLSPPYSTYLLPVGLTRISATGQNPNASIDPLVFLDLLLSSDKPEEMLSQIWDAIEVPLSVDSIGKKTLITMGLNGLEINKVDD